MLFWKKNFFYTLYTFLYFYIIHIAYILIFMEISRMMVFDPTNTDLSGAIQVRMNIMRKDALIEWRFELSEGFLVI